MRYAFLFVMALLVAGLAGCGSGKEGTGSKKEQAAPVATNGEPTADAATAPEAKEPEAPPAPPKAEKIIYIIVDALRADRVGCYGFDKEVTPAMDKMAAEGVLFENMHAASPWTAPSFGTLFTGVSPTVHGAGGILASGSSKGKSIHGVTVGGVRQDLPTMGELLPFKQKGAIVNNSFVSEALGFARGFDHFDYKNARLTSYRTADQVTDAAIEWLKGNHKESFLYVVHYFDPHIQYGPPKKYLPMFAPKKPPRIHYPFVDHASARDGSLNPSEAEKEFIRGLYYGETRFVDDEMARLRVALEEMGLMDDAWIVILSDHGEEHFDHGSFDHGHRYEEEVVRVPFILRAPGGKWRAGERVAANVSHVDVLPTMLDLAGVEAPGHLEGRTVLPLIEGTESESRESYMEFNLFSGQQCAIFDGRYKLVHDVRRERNYMYDLQEDPGETNKLDDTHPEFARLRKRIDEKRAALAEAAKGGIANEGTLSEESRQALESLGYIKK